MCHFSSLKSRAVQPGDCAARKLFLLPLLGGFGCTLAAAGLAAFGGFALGAGAGFLFRLLLGLLAGHLFRLLLHLLRLGFDFRSGELLSIERNFRNADGGKRLTVSLQLFVLLFALEVEDENLVAA